MSSQYTVPATPRVISPSPTPSEQSGKDGYFAPTTRSKTVRQSSSTSIDPIKENYDDHEEDPELARARARSRSPQIPRKLPQRAGEMNGSITTSTAANGPIPTRRKKTEDLKSPPNGQPNGFLSPDSALPKGFGSAYWRNLSRSPSPLGLIPIHREWRTFIHKHEIPRKALHVSIGFFASYLYYQGYQPDDIHPYLLYAFVPIFALDLARFKWDALNRLYIKCVGAFMRESEAHDRFNGVISYLGGIWVTLFFCKKDIALMSILLLSWCDTAASTFGRLYGKYTPRIRRGKSLAGSLAAFAVGVVTSVLFWGWLAPITGGTLDQGENHFAFQGSLGLPVAWRDQLLLTMKQATISGGAALGVVSVVSGFVASVSEAMDLWGLDDNLTIPILCGAGLTGFLWCFGAAGS